MLSGGGLGFGDLLPGCVKTPPSGQALALQVNVSMYALETHSTIISTVELVLPPVVWIGDHVDQGVPSEGEDYQDVGEGVVPLGQAGGGKQEVGLVVQGEDYRGEGADDVTEEHCHRSTSSLCLRSPQENESQHL